MIREIIILFSPLLISLSSFGQGFLGASYYPSIVFEKDTIKLIDTVETAMYYDIRTNTSITKYQDTIKIAVCYKINGGPTIGRRDINTTILGVLPVGNYHLILAGKYYSGSDTACTNSNDTFFNSLSFDLVVQNSPTDFTDLLFLNSIIVPTVVKDKIEISGLPNERSVIEVYDLQGKILHSITTKNSTASLQMGNLTSGVYVISIRIGSEQRRWKILKE